MNVKDIFRAGNKQLRVQKWKKDLENSYLLFITAQTKLLWIQIHNVVSRSELSYTVILSILIKFWSYFFLTIAFNYQKFK